VAELMVMASTDIIQLVTFQCFGAIYSGNGKRQWTPERNAIGHTHGSDSTGATA
jgi:hypothetical protein